MGDESQQKLSIKSKSKSKSKKDEMPDDEDPNNLSFDNSA